MSSKPEPSFNMNTSGESPMSIEERLQKIAAGFVYPPTPEFARRERERLAKPGKAISRRQPGRLALGLVVVVILILAALLVTPVRARVLDWIQIGAARIFSTLATETPVPPASAETPSTEIAPTLIESVLDLAGETSLAAAQDRLNFTVQLPAYPEDLGEPDHVYFQRWGVSVIVLVWMDADQPDRVRLSLTEASSDEPIFQKYTSTTILNTHVNGQPAVWIDGEYLLIMGDGDAAMTRLVNQGHTLIWTHGKLTYRLETDVELETAIQIAESVR